MRVGQKVTLHLVDETVITGIVERITDEYVVVKDNNVHYDVVMVYHANIKKIIVPMEREAKQIMENNDKVYLVYTDLQGNHISKEQSLTDKLPEDVEPGTLIISL